MKSSGLNEDKTQSQSSALRQTSKGRELRIYNKKNLDIGLSFNLQFYLFKRG